MKFPKNSAHLKEINNNFKVYEYCPENSSFPIDGAVVHLNCTFGPKVNKFTELFFVLDGTLEIEINNEKHIIEQEDMFIAPQGIVHTVIGHNAKVFIVCNPPFKPENMEFI